MYSLIRLGECKEGAYMMLKHGKSKRSFLGKSLRP